MIRMLFRFVVLVALGVGVALWLVDELGLERPRTLKLRTVHLEDVVDAALDRARGAVAALPRSAPPPGPGSEPEAAPESVADEAGEPAMVEELIEDPEPFVEAPLPEAEEDGTREEEVPEDAPVMVASRDQDAWARLIRRMLDLYARTEPR